MSYMHIENLYRDKTILLFKEVFALEKIHGASSHISWRLQSSGEDAPNYRIHFFAGATKQATFLKLFNQEELHQKLLELGHPEVTIFGEAYGGKIMRMSATYGKELRFVAFEVKIGPCWLSVPQAHEVATHLGLDFVYYKLVPTTLDALDAEKEADSVQAVKCGMGEGHKREGIVLRPLIEFTRNNGERVICKYKRKDFEEVATPREVTAETLKVLSDAEEIANEWVTEMRMAHVLSGFPDATTSDMGNIIRTTLEDVLREGVGEIEVTREAKRAICTRTGQLLKRRLIPKKEV